MKNTKLVDISEIKIGDTILDINGIERTVSNTTISKNSFTGITLNGDPYLWQNRKVERVIYPIWRNGICINLEEVTNENN